MLYSFKSAYPQKLPSIYENYTLDELLEFGFIKTEDPPVPISGNFVEWTGTDWIIREANQSEIDFKWQEIRHNRNKLLQASDMIIIKLYENEFPVPSEIKVYRQLLRDVTKQADPWNIEWPIMPEIEI